MANVPLDIWMNICDIVADTKDETTLMACSLVRPDLTAHCQKHLFSNITVAFRRNSSASNLCQILERHPWLISTIQSLEFEFNSKDQFYFPTIPSLLSKCKNVPSFSLRFRIQSHRNLSLIFHFLMVGTQNSVMNILASPTLTSLCIDGFHLPITIISRLIQGNLKHLEATGGLALPDETSSTWQMPSSTRSNPIFLLSLKANSSMLSALLKAKLADDSTYLFDFTYLQTLTAVEFDNAMAITALLRRTPQLNTLHLDLSGQSVSVEGLLDFHPPFCSSLRHIEFVVAIVESDDPGLNWDAFYYGEQGLPGPVSDAMLPSLVQELLRLPPANVVESVQFCVRYRIDGKLSSTAILEDNWLALKSLGNGVFPCLENVHVHVAVEDWNGCSENEWIVNRIAAMLEDDPDRGFRLTSSFEYSWKWSGL